MAVFSHKSIKHKLTLIIMGTTAASLLLAGICFLIYEYIAAPRIVANNLSSLAVVIANNTTAAIVFNDENAASETLGGLRATPNVLEAHIFRKDGSLFASYNRDGNTMPRRARCPRFEGYWLHDGGVELCRTIALNAQTVGALSLSSDLEAMTDRIRSFAQIVSVVLLISLVFAFLISKFLQRMLSGPILSLADLSRRISAQQDYSVRATKSSEDEIGVLVDGFNAMLMQIENRDLALQAIQTQLEERVAELQREVAERKRAEKDLAAKQVELQRSNEELQQFAYVASHDLQEPLRMVSSYTQLLVKRYQDKLDETAKEFIQFAVGGVKRMQGLILDLLEFSRVGTRANTFAPVSCEAVVLSALLNLDTAIRESRTAVTRDVLPSVMGDESQLVQLFQNLIGNAIKYRSRETPKIHVGCEKYEGSWLFSVSDNGIGFDPQYAERIFIIFQRLHNSEDYPGTGIGLAISKKIVERHGGRIWADTEPGKGSKFCFTLPVAAEGGREYAR